MRPIDADAISVKSEIESVREVVEIILDNAPTLKAIVIPENPTNGDIIKAMFPDAEITDHFEMGTPIGNIIYVRLCEYQEMRVQEDWWNAPYKAVSE